MGYYLKFAAMEIVLANPGWLRTKVGLEAIAAQLADIAVGNPYWSDWRKMGMQELGSRARGGHYRGGPARDADAEEYITALPLMVLVRRSGWRGREFTIPGSHYYFKLVLHRPYGTVHFLIADMTLEGIRLHSE